MLQVPQQKKKIIGSTHETPLFPLHFNLRSFRAHGFICDDLSDVYFLNSLILIYQMTSVSDFEGFLSLILVFICTCVHIRRIPFLRNYFLNSKHSVVSQLLKRASAVGLKFQWTIGAICVALSILVLIG
jgi:hypothetical protein